MNLLNTYWSLFFRVIESFEEMLQADIDVNKNIGKFGAEHILFHNKEKAVNILTHCNTGSLATAGYGTALGMYCDKQTALVH